MRVETTSSARTPALVSLLGPITVRGSDGPRLVAGRLDRAILVQLALAEGRVVPVAMLIDALWPEGPPATARNALQVKVSRLRGLLGEQAHRLEYRQGGYRLRLQPGELDLDQFATGLERAEQALGNRDPATALAELAPVLACWQGDPLAEFADHPRVAAALPRIEELHATALEAYAEARLADPRTCATAIADLRELLQREPMRPRARRALMQGLELSGRRAEALAVYDAGRKLFLAVGLEPPQELQVVFDHLLTAERQLSRRASQLRPATGAPPDGLLETARWLAADGDLPGSLKLSVRGSWWWWSRGPRGPARELLADLLEGAQPSEDSSQWSDQLSARAWLGVFGSTSAQAALSLRVAEQALLAGRRPAWTRHDALAAVIIAERLYDRGDPTRASRLLRLATRHFAVTDDPQGEALCGVVAARGQLLAGDVVAAHEATYQRLIEFQRMPEPAGQVMCLDTLGYCAEVLGDLARAETLHRQALEQARRHGSPEWEAAQLTRLGNVLALAGANNAQSYLKDATTLSAEIGSETILALARNGQGLALQLTGDTEAAAQEHAAAWSYYSQARSPAGLSYTGARLAVVQADDQASAKRWAIDSLHHAVPTRDPRAIAHSLESLALVDDDPHAATLAGGAAWALRRSAAARLPTVQQQPLSVRRRALARALGSKYATLWRRGAGDPRGVAVHLAAAGTTGRR